MSVALVAACDPAPTPPPAPATGSAGGAAPAVVRAAITASKDGFQPALVRLQRGKRGVLEFTRIDDTACVNAVKMPWLDKPVDLPKGKTVTIEVDTSKDGTFSYGCWMGMVFGRVEILP